MSDERSAPTLVGDLLTQTTDLFRKEVQLLRAEMGEKANQAGIAAGMILGAVVLALVALNVLAAALVAALSNIMNAGWAALIVGGILAVIAWFMASKGITDLKATNLAPERTANAVSKDASMAKGSVS